MKTIIRIYAITALSLSTIMISAQTKTDTLEIMNNMSVASNATDMDTIQSATIEESFSDTLNQSSSLSEESLSDTLQSVRLLPRVGHVFSVGVRGGCAAFMPKMEWKWGVGFNVPIDFRYTYFFQPFGKMQPPYYLGVTTGLSLNYLRSGIKTPVDITYQVEDVYGYEVDYHISAQEIRERNGQIMFEIPILASFYWQGLFVDAGFKFNIPVYSHFIQTAKAIDIEAYYPITGVTVVNAPITGRVDDVEHKTKGKWNSGTFYFLFSADIGYQWELPLGAIGLGAYMDISMCSVFHKADYHFTTVELPSQHQATRPQVNINSLVGSEAEKMNLFDVGVKLTYYFGLDEIREHINNKQAEP